MLLTAENLDQIAQLDQKNATLLARRAEVLEVLAAIDRDIARVAIEKAEFSPLYHIHEDVLKIILEEACAHSPPPTLLSCSDHLSPLTATHICRRWRRTSIALPTIWTCIRPSSRIELLKLWLERSANLTLQLWSTPYDTVDQNQAGVVFEHAHRWKSIIAGPLDLLSHIVYVEKKSPQLEALEYVDIQYGSSPPLPTIVTQIPTPKLKHLSLASLYVVFRQSRLPDLQFLRLKDTMLSHEDLSDLALVAPNLVELVLDRITEGDDLRGGWKS